MSDSSATQNSRQPHSTSYYKRLLTQGSGPQWRHLMNDVKQNYDIAFAVAEACGQLGPNYVTTQTLWKSAIESAQPGIRIDLSGSMGEDMKVRGLKKTQYHDPSDM